MATTLTVFRPFLAAALVVACAAPLASAQQEIPPRTNNTSDLGLIADPGDVISFTATSSSTDPMYLYIFDSNGDVLLGASAAFASSLVTQLPHGTYLLAVWHGFTPPSDGYRFNNVASPQSFTLEVDGTLFDDSIECTGNPFADCFLNVRYYNFYVGGPMIQPLGRAVTSKAHYDITMRDIDERTPPRIYLFGEDGSPIFFNELSNEPGRYVLACLAGGTADDRFVLGDPGIDPGSRIGNLTFGGVVVETISVPDAGIVWLSWEVRDEGPDTVVSVDFTDLQPVPIAMTALQTNIAPSVALFRESDGALIETAAMTGTARLDRALEPGDYILAANGAGTGYGDGFTTLPLTSGFGTDFDYDIAIGVGRFFNQTIEPGGDTDFYRFTVEPTPNLGEIAEGPQAFTFETSSADPARDTGLALYSDDGLLLSADDNGGVGDLSSLDVPNGLPGGSYVIAAAGGGTVFADGFVPQVDGDEDAGDYTLEYIGLSEPSDLGFGGDVDMYRFEVGVPTDLGELGGPGDTITFNTIGSQFNTAIAVWDENGTLLETSDVPSIALDSIERVYPSGVYHFGVAGGGATFADGFRISVTPAGPLGSYTGVAGGQFYDGTTSELDRFDLFRFEIAETCNAADIAAPFDTLDAQDFLLYLTLVQNGTAPDFDGEAGQTFFDTLHFLTLVDEGCP